MRRSVARKNAQDFKKLMKGKKGPEGEHILGSSQFEAIASLRSMPIPPAPEGSGDMGERDHVDPVAYRRDRNARKRARRKAR